MAVRNFLYSLLLGVIITFSLQAAEANTEEGNIPQENLSLQPDPIPAGDLPDILTAIRAALQKEIFLTSAKLDIDIAQEGYLQQKAGYYPQITFSSGASYTGSETQRKVKSDSTPYDVTLSLSQKIYDRVTLATLDRSHASLAQSRIALDAKKREIIETIIQTYLDVQQQKELKILARQNFAITEKNYEATKFRREAGELTETDLNQSRARLAKARLQIIGFDNDWDSILARFTHRTGRQPAESLASFRFSEALIAIVEQEASKFIEKRTDLQQAELKVRLAEMDVDIARYGYQPTISLNASAARNWTGTSSSSSGAYGDTWSAGVAVSIPVFEGGRIASKIRQTKYQVRSEQEQWELARLEALLEIKVALVDIKKLRETATMNAEALKASQDALSGVTQEFQSGTRTALDVLNAQSEAFTNEIEQLKTGYSILKAEMRLLKSVGLLTQESLTKGGFLVQ